MGDTRYGIYSCDGTPIVIHVYDKVLQEIISAMFFKSREVAQDALDLIEHDLLESYGEVIIREIIEA